MRRQKWGTCLFPLRQFRMHVFPHSQFLCRHNNANHAIIFLITQHALCRHVRSTYKQFDDQRSYRSISASFELATSETNCSTASIKLFASSRNYFIPSYADTSAVPQSHSSPFSTKPFPQVGGATMVFISGMLVKHFGMSFSMYFSKSWRLQELNNLGMMELYWERRRTRIRIIIDKEKQ